MAASKRRNGLPSGGAVASRWCGGLSSQLKECLPSLMGLNPCMGYLTNTSVPSPPAAYCAGFKSLVHTGPICLCHCLNGDISTLMPATRAHGCHAHDVPSGLLLCPAPAAGSRRLPRAHVSFFSQ
ncbi:hypothetical protein BRADI_3g23320v3 [Brachypodium distachyon]|uniref:Bifunctional inhibitor/plant lipid transfer protein/seed storage helical domain-containing protein n=1 Tax=Brachypodium distachyon TaxID=15368 RepID=I1I3N4_BRADI|nr:hypothetical protein BRADI_3g23320v3 [Brachypodium distachyon]PNT67281.1 hypothetical protein BRADI_3g23320v3 [Brachypodium distachyon]